ncbi:GNAT family N-acetyltransferase [Saccharopolyspora shandongensis]|uniref:GNAT family N-acetyltransferase n=1 Tax=Saccharopolyspora shandongensis TaxID=418495 RepID=UPI003439D892
MDLIVRRATPAELDRIVPAYAAACADEAVSSWVTSGRELPGALYRDSVREALGADEVLVAQRADGTIEGLSVWLTLRSAERIRREAAVLAESAGADPVLRRMATVLTLVAQRHPDEPHVFLSSMGVLAASRGSGVGSAILRHRLHRADADAQPTYLEASTPRNQALYARHGFEPLGQPIALPDDGPRLQPMWREPRVTGG